MREHPGEILPLKDERGGFVGQMITACPPAAVQLRRILRYRDRRRCRLPGRLDLSRYITRMP